MGRWQANMGRHRRIRNGGGPAQQDGRGGSSFAASLRCPHVQRGAIGRLYLEQSWGEGEGGSVERRGPQGPSVPELSGCPPHSDISRTRSPIATSPMS